MRRLGLQCVGDSFTFGSVPSVLAPGFSFGPTLQFWTFFAIWPCTLVLVPFTSVLDLCLTLGSMLYFGIHASVRLPILQFPFPSQALIRLL